MKQTKVKVAVAQVPVPFHNLSAQMLDGSIIPVQVQATDTVGHMKEMLAEETGIPAWKQVLAVEGSESGHQLADEINIEQIG